MRKSKVHRAAFQADLEAAFNGPEWVDGGDPGRRWEQLLAVVHKAASGRRVGVGRLLL